MFEKTGTCAFPTLSPFNSHVPRPTPLRRGHVDTKDPDIHNFFCCYAALIRTRNMDTCALPRRNTRCRY